MVRRAMLAGIVVMATVAAFGVKANGDIVTEAAQIPPTAIAPSSAAVGLCGQVGAAVSLPTISLSFGGTREDVLDLCKTLAIGESLGRHDPFLELVWLEQNLPGGRRFFAMAGYKMPRMQKIDGKWWNVSPAAKNNQEVEMDERWREILGEEENDDSKNVFDTLPHIFNRR